MWVFFKLLTSWYSTGSGHTRLKVTTEPCIPQELSLYCASPFVDLKCFLLFFGVRIFQDLTRKDPKEGKGRTVQAYQGAESPDQG